MENNQKECMVCKKIFTPCTSCDKLKVFYKDEMYQWRKVVCCPEHFHYHMPIIEYSRGKIDKVTAKQQLQSTIDLLGEIEFNDNVKGLVNEILSEDVTNDDNKENKTESIQLKKKSKK